MYVGTPLPKKGFTIVELLIVIVVIAILASVVIISYSGIQQRARVASVTTGLSQAVKKIETEKALDPAGQYPATLPAGIADGTTTYVYSYDSASNYYCITATSSSIQYFSTPTIQEKEGDCTTVNGLISWWPLNSDAKDYAHGNNNGTVNGATPANNRAGEANRAYHFTAANLDSISISPTTLPEAEATISLWARSDNNNLIQTYFYYGTPGEDGCSGAPSIVLSTCGFTIQSPSSGAANLGVPALLLDGSWHHFVGSWKGGASQYGRVYIDGAEYSSGAIAVTPDPAAVTAYIGRPGAGTRGANGEIDDVRVYGRQLSASEVLKLYQNGPH